MLYPADPPTVEEIVGVTRHASEDPHGFRLRAMIVMLWRGGLRVQEALAGRPARRARGLVGARAKVPHEQHPR
jgi:site-specific recombinase XerD